MKNNLILILSILLATGVSFGYDRVYFERTPYPIYNSYGYCCPNRYINSPVYYPYWIQRTVNFVNAPTTKPRRYQRVRRLERLQKNYNQLSWLGKNQNGSLTGYSVPVTKDIYKQMGITPFDPNSKVRINSPTCNQDLFSVPSGDEMYYKNGERYTDLKGASGKAGVTIIYD